MELAEHDKQRFKADPTWFIEDTIKHYVANSYKNRLEAFDNSCIFDEPLVGFANGDDPLFQHFKQLIGDFYLTPREALDRYRQSKNRASECDPYVSVIAWINPIAYETRLSLRQETRVPSLRWNHTRWHGEDLIVDTAYYLVSLLEELGYEAVSPMNSDFWQVVPLPNGPASNWSHRHNAYPCGLGTFSLNDGFITPRGIAHRCYSIVTSGLLAPSPKPYISHVANCLFYRKNSCGRCAKRCPAGAITEKGHDKRKCQQYLNVQKDMLRQLGRDKGYIGRYAGCGLCQTGVPCEDTIPISTVEERE